MPKGGVFLRKLCICFLLLCSFCLLLLAGCIAYLWQRSADSVPVLNYHQINDTEQNPLTVNTEQFEEQMKYLADNGYHTITPTEMVDAWEKGTQLPAKPVILTFDDGYLDNYLYAFPILEKYRLKATIFLISDYVNTYPNYLTWANVYEMQESGLINFESHTLNHVELTETGSEKDTIHQLQGSRKALEYHLKKPVRFIAYPCGSYNDEVERLTKDAGYLGAFTVDYGLASPEEQRFVLDRIPIFGCNSHTFLRFKLRLALAPLFSPLSSWKSHLQKTDHPWLANLITIP